MKKISIITIIVGALMLIVGIVPFFLSFLVIPNTPSIGIIGGADFQTLYIFWSGSLYNHLAFWGVVALIVGVVLLIINKFKKK